MRIKTCLSPALPDFATLLQIMGCGQFSEEIHVVFNEKEDIQNILQAMTLSKLNHEITIGTGNVCKSIVIS